jgi:PPE-repeat protein
MDFGTLPPEITAALIHSGPGAGSWIEASGMWQQLAIELEDSLPGYGSVLSSLTDAWSGPSSAAMIQAVEPYLSWVRTTAQQCERLASSAAAAAAAFNSAVAAVVHPAYVSANRVRLAKLLATNWFGTNLGAIAATEDEYAGMWANNSAAMYRYQAASAQVFELSQFSSPPAIVNPAAAAAAQAGAVPTAAAGTPAASLLQSIFAPNTNATGTGLAGLLNLFSGSAQSSFGSLLNSIILNQAILTSTFPGSGIPINLLSYLAQSSSAQSLQTVGGELGQGLSQGAEALGATANQMANAVRAVGSAGSPTAAVGVGVSLGKLSAPPATVGLLTASQAPVQLASAASPLAAEESGFPFLPPPMMPPVVPRKGKGKGEGKREGRDYDDLEIGLEIKGTFMTRPPSAG